MAEAVLSDIREGIMRLTVNLPERRNPLTRDVLAALYDNVRRAADGSDVRVIVIEGAGGRAFSAGGDLSNMSDGESFSDAHRGRGTMAQLFNLMWDSGIPTIAKVAGYALAGGCGLALACDFVIAADDAVFGLPEIDVGLWPFMVTVPLLRSMPPKVALDLMLTGRRVDAAEAKALGFVSQVVAPDVLETAVGELAMTLASKPAETVRLGRDAFYAVVDQRASDALRLLHPMLTVALQTDAAAEGLAAFAERRPPRWR